MKPRYYVLAIAVLSGLTLALVRRRPHDVQADSAPAHSTAVTSAVALTQSASAMAGPQPPPAAEGRNPQAADPLAELKRRLDDPRQREANLLRAKLNIEQTHGRIFQRLRNLPPEILDRLKLVLAENQLAMERGALPDRFPVDDSAAEAANENLSRIAKEGDEQVRALLGDEGYAQYSLSRQAEPYRESIEQVTNIMRARGAEVTEDMQERILDSYTRALVAAAKISANDMTPAAFRALSESARQELRLKQQLRFDEILASTMSATLSPTEYTLFMDAQFAQDQSTR
ncbi:MAG TPA: hypothetical protein VIM71_02295 [Lacunisphaera sp.]